MRMWASILKGSALLAPFAIVGTVLVNVLHASDLIVYLFVVGISVCCGLIPVIFDPDSDKRRHS